ncbi:formate/nitrite transporter family protein [Paenibacillus sp. NFR01]|uniref:formate/nitrite transporter family protein n=1 Tax=Paenibacillus sp. NFR01 TaxID=1566279 RepID=UPI0008C22152|nr:formate/nitrite transporter family protein [Paenibacillus sp. NFR01]SET19593.1 formate/nitrite transporter [Paenibacillus sp. NFR01]
MDYVKPGEVLSSMIEAGRNKAELSIGQMLVRGALGGAILACATTLAYTAAAQTKLPIVGAILFPVGFVMIILLGLELVTGSFALVPLAVLEKKTTSGKMLRHFFWVIVGHLLGCAAYAALYGLTLTKMGTDMSNPLIQTLISNSEAKTTAYQALGGEGMLLAFIKAILCNWMVTLGAVLAMTSKSTLGKIVAMWLPILTFFAQGFEHTVVNFFVIPAGMMLGAQVSFADWWVWNGIPVLLGNLAGGLLFTGLLLYLSHKGALAGGLNGARATIAEDLPVSGRTPALEKSL